MLAWTIVSTRLPRVKSQTEATHGSITAAQASVGTAAACPTTGTIFKAAEVTRQGAAITPQPASPIAMAATAATLSPALKRLPPNADIAITNLHITTCLPEYCDKNQTIVTGQTERGSKQLLPFAFSIQ